MREISITDARPVSLKKALLFVVDRCAQLEGNLQQQIDSAKADKLAYLPNVQKGICQAIEEQKQLTELMSSDDILRISQLWQFYRYETDITTFWRGSKVPICWRNLKF